MTELSFAASDTDAATRFSGFRDVDPFANEIDTGLLNIDQVRKYVAKTGMIWPFHDDTQHRKGASYEVRVLGKCVCWRDDGTKEVVNLVDGNEFKLRKNSISFVTLEPRFRIPRYMAVRFNLKVTHVYRGLLAGTGPLVDPGYDNYLYLPLHNLTTNDYVLRSGDPLVWMEFTKLTVAPDAALPIKDLPRASDKEPKDVEFYLRKADPNRAIQSSIPAEVGRAIKVAEATQARVTALSYAALITAILAAGAIVWPIIDLLKDAFQINATATERLEETRRGQQLTREQQAELEKRIVRLEKELAARRRPTEPKPQ
jgi:deoxycytidine triphosphate deaminase